MKIADFQKAVVLQFFPTLVWRQELPEVRAKIINDKLIGAIEDALAPRPEPSPGVGWQTEQDLHLRPDFAELAQVIEAVAEAALKSIHADHRGVAITGCWANINPPNARHRGHTHPNNFLSGVYYVKVPRGAHHISFSDPRAQNSVMQPRYSRDTVLNASAVNMEVQDGVMVLFPAWLEHEVRRNASNDERITIAFNLMLKDFLETVSPPIWEPKGRAAK